MITLDRKMPKSCWTCHFAAQQGNSGPMYCFTEASDPRVCEEDYMECRPKWCPLAQASDNSAMQYAKGYLCAMRALRKSVDSAITMVEEQIDGI